MVDLTVTMSALSQKCVEGRVGSWDQHILGAMTSMQAGNQKGLIGVGWRAQECGQVVETAAVLMELADSTQLNYESCDVCLVVCCVCMKSHKYAGNSLHL